jgi:hypothetical protein
VLALTLVLLAASGVADPAVRFESVPEPSVGDVGGDPCRDRGPGGRWVQMATAGAPASIHGWSWLDSAAVWTGTRLVVALRKNGKWSGPSFDPCENVWSPAADIARLIRNEPWLSDDTDRPFRTLGRAGSYDGFGKVAVWDEANDAWVAVTAAQEPLAPRAHYAVAVAGRRFMVWGGWTKASSVVNDGAVLDLGRKSWKPMAQSGAPSPRLDPTAVVWTGTRLIVWGGRAPTSTPGSLRVLGDGAQYDPVADRWKPLPAAGAPAARTQATAVWTGRRMVVIGGSADIGGPAMRDGAIYDPTTDRWQRLEPPPANVTLPRANVGPLTRILVTRDGRVVFLPDRLEQVVVLDADHAAWSIIDAAPLGKRDSFRAFLLGRRLIVWGGQTVVAEFRCPPPVAGQPMCDPFAQTAARDDGWMMLLPPRAGEGRAR